MISKDTCRYKVLTLLLGVIVLYPIFGIAGESEGKTGLAFLKIGVDARAIAMGEAYTAVSNNGFATYWNPAGLMASDGSNAVFSHNNWLDDVNTDFGAIHFRRTNSSLAFHAYNLNIGGIEVRSGPSEVPLEESSANYLSIGATYARQQSEKLSYGLTVKGLFEKVFVESARGFAVDLGVNYTGLAENLVVGAVLQNFGSMGELVSEATKLPATIRVGSWYQMPGKVGPANFSLAADVVKPLEEDLRFHVGTEAQFSQSLFVRLGYALGYETRNFSAGLGLARSAFHFDYSLTPFQNDFGTGHRFSLYIEI